MRRGAGQRLGQSDLKIQRSRWRRFALSLPVVAIAITAFVISSINTPVQAASSTALKWTPQSAAAPNGWARVVWSPELNLFAAISANGTNRVMTSTDGKTWTPRTAPSDAWASLAWSPQLGMFVALAPGSNQAITSTDGITWTLRTTAPNGGTWTDVTWSPGAGLFVAVSCGTGTGCDAAATNRVMTSPDGINWTARASASQTNDWWGITWSPALNLFVAVSATGTQQVMTSPDAINWTGRTVPAGSWYKVTWSPELNLFVSTSAGGANSIMTSPDGINWTARTAPQANDWRSVTWSPELDLFVAVSRTGTQRIMTSPDGITWTGRPAPQNNQWWSVAYSPALQAFTAVSADGTNRVMTGSMVTATTNAATNITNASATLNGEYLDNYPGATVFFRYRVAGSSNPYTTTAPQVVTSDGSFSANISGLSTNTTYEYTIVVQWPSAGGTQELMGGLETFTAVEYEVRYHKTVSPVVTSITPGQTFTYTITVENVGSGPLTGLSFTDDLTDVIDDAAYNSDVNATIGTATFNTNEIQWSGNVGVGQTATVTYSFTMNNPTTGDGQLNNGVVGNGPGSNCTADPAIDPDCQTTTPLPVLASQKTLVGPASPEADDTVTYQFTIDNTGGSAAADVAAADDLGEVLDDAAYNNDASATSGTITYDSTSQRLIWNGDLAAAGNAGDSVTVTYSVTVNDATSLGDAVLNNALISPDCPSTPIFDSNAPGYEANCVTSTPVSAWMATKTTTATSGIKPGATANYTITVTNTGATNLTGATAPALDDDLTDVIDDANFDSTTAQATAGVVSYASPTLHWTGDLNAGQSATITYSAVVKPLGSLGNANLANAIGAGPMNCPVAPTSNSADPNFSASCATLTSVDTADPATPPTTPPSSGGLADTGQNLLTTALAAAALVTGGLALAMKKRLFVKG